MSAMAKMFADMILKEIPPEIREAITAENIARVQQNISNLLTFYKESLEGIKAEQLEQKLMLEKVLENVGNGNSGKPARAALKRIDGPGGVATGSD